MPKTKTQSRPARPPQPQLVTDLRSIESRHREAVIMDIAICGWPFRFTGQRLVPAEANRVKTLMELALPPLLPPEQPGGEARYDFDNPDYKARHESCRRNARALALWLGYPCFKAEAKRLISESGKREGGKAEETLNIEHSTPNAELVKLPETVEEIGAFIESRAMDDDALQLLFKGLTQNTVELQGFVNFTSGNGFPKS